MKEYKSKESWLIIAAVVLVLAFAFQGSRGLWEPDEGRYVRCAYEMQKTDNWIVPQRNYQPHFTKPPTTYWLIASGIRLFGRNDWGARHRWMRLTREDEHTLKSDSCGLADTGSGEADHRSASLSRFTNLNDSSMRSYICRCCST